MFKINCRNQCSNLARFRSPSIVGVNLEDHEVYRLRFSDGGESITKENGFSVDMSHIICGAQILQLWKPYLYVIWLGKIRDFGIRGNGSSLIQLKLFMVVSGFMADFRPHHRYFSSQNQCDFIFLNSGSIFCIHYLKRSSTKWEFLKCVFFQIKKTQRSTDLLPVCCWLHV